MLFVKGFASITYQASVLPNWFSTLWAYSSPGCTWTKNCNKEVFANAIEEGRSEDYLNVVDVKKGDCFLINSGLVHAICEGLIIAEIQHLNNLQIFLLLWH